MEKERFQLFQYRTTLNFILKNMVQFIWHKKLVLSISTNDPLSILNMQLNVLLQMI